ncbi:MAG: DNA-3-methyladenine glycosylase 2 family protein [Patescibacteria group bacterium]|nr:DNA-3-methyladenine glycosylase 2 family protein [Patescibacteria group bacterium]MDE2590939.1 DNA-3-methyladenine glycosylase 2 family protein [Patescibacteria group bacterium]
MAISDPVLQKLIKKYPAPTFTDRSAFLFEDLIESIISQQLSVKASDTIFKRFKLLFKHKTFPSPQEVLETNEQNIRTAGISFQKISYIKNIATAFANDKINIEEIKNMTDEEVILYLTKLKGVGKWTAEMILIFTLNRPDVFSLGDLGLRRAVERLYGITDHKEILTLSETWKPNRSTASWYLWRSLENSF